jgi:uncharacterized protein
MPNEKLSQSQSPERSGRWQRPITIVGLLLLLMLLCLLALPSLERLFLFFPSRWPADTDLTPWQHEDEIIGYARMVESPQTVWLLLHGNAGQAADRTYALPCFAAEDTVYIMEYPGYGRRAGTPSKESFNQAAQEAYRLLRERYPDRPVAVAAESLGSGPAAYLATLPQPPDKLVFIVPFARLVDVAEDYFPAFLVRLALRSDWDNVAALANYEGPVDVFGAAEDRVIPVRHAETLATAVPQANLVIFDGGHNDWAAPCRMEIRNP